MEDRVSGSLSAAVTATSARGRRARATHRLRPGPIQRERWQCLALVYAVALFCGLFAAAPASAQSDQGLAALQFGHGQPARTSDIPPGQLRRKLDSLPSAAAGRALQWLQDIEFTGADLDVLRADDEGGILFADTLLPNAAQAGATVDGASAAAAPSTTLDDAFVLHSKPGSANRVFLDFDGDVISGTAWNASGAASYSARPYDLDGDPFTFNATERTRIVDIWHRVAEDLAPFDIDVTTEAPATFDRYTGHVLITHSVDESGTYMPYNTAGGVAYINVFGQSNYASYYSPALVYYNNLGGGVQTYVAEASSHEFGHNLGLSHDGTVSGTTYYAGHGTGLVSWAPIMGNSYYNNVTQFSRGEYPDANQTQDDLAIIAGKLGYDADDHGDSPDTGSALQVEPDGSVVSSNPELDPHNLLPGNKGVIESPQDTDVFTFVAGSGTVSLTVTPSWDAFYAGTSRRGSNLDIRAELRNAAGALVAESEPTDDTRASFQVNVSAGTYHLLVSGVGNATTPYPDYDSRGEYFINGTVPPATSDTTAPTPNPMTWATPPVANGDSAIDMAATVASDETSAVQYRFNCVTGGGAGCTGSGWQDSPSYTATGLAANTLYTWTVAARDASGNQTMASAPASATTDEPPPPPAYVEYLPNGEVLVAGVLSGNLTDARTADGGTESVTETESNGKPDRRYTYLEHRWSFAIGTGASATVYANAWSGGSSDGDTFDFEYSLDGGSGWHFMFNVAATSVDNMESFQLPGSPGGTVWVRVVDTNQASGAREPNTVYVDQILIQVAHPPSDPPDGDPSGLTATAASASRIDLVWIDNAGNESSYRIERSPDGAGGWTVVAELPADSTNYGDTGLEASTTYWYRVSAYNLNGISAYATASATTQAAPPPQPLSLTASGYKVKGVQRIDLTWSGATSVDVYRDGSRIATGVSGTTWTDDTGNKGGGSYTHQVCVAGGRSECSEAVTTAF